MVSVIETACLVILSVQ